MAEETKQGDPRFMVYLGIDIDRREMTASGHRYMLLPPGWNNNHGVKMEEIKGALPVYFTKPLCDYQRPGTLFEAQVTQREVEGVTRHTVHGDGKYKERWANLDDVIAWEAHNRGLEGELEYYRLARRETSIDPLYLALEPIRAAYWQEDTHAARTAILARVVAYILRPTELYEMKLQTKAKTKRKAKR